MVYLVLLYCKYSKWKNIRINIDIFNKARVPNPYIRTKTQQSRKLDNLYLMLFILTSENRLKMVFKYPVRVDLATWK